ncbi:MAG: hypothetical protein COA78_26440 [Blastopirellula sp.]|nr:MAG: hypothetical protein COA78_26440 [Blastopirellula sp.]
MGRIGLAFKLFFGVLFNSNTALQMQTALLPAPAAKEPEKKTAAKPQPPAAPAGLDALVLLATLQREARFLDLFQEDLESFDDAQIGAAVRDVQRDTKKVLARLFAIEALRTEEEGANIELPESIKPHEIRLTGNVGNDTPASGKLAHHGWKATKCEIPKFQGNLETAKVIAPAEIEIV